MATLQMLLPQGNSPAPHVLLSLPPCNSGIDFTAFTDVSPVEKPPVQPSAGVSSDCRPAQC